MGFLFSSFVSRLNVHRLLLDPPVPASMLHESLKDEKTGKIFLENLSLHLSCHRSEEESTYVYVREDDEKPSYFADLFWSKKPLLTRAPFIPWQCDCQFSAITSPRPHSCILWHDSSSPYLWLRYEDVITQEGIFHCVAFSFCVTMMAASPSRQSAEAAADFTVIVKSYWLKNGKLLILGQSKKVSSTYIRQLCTVFYGSDKKLLHGQCLLPLQNSCCFTIRSVLWENVLRGYISSWQRKIINSGQS